MTRIPSPHLFRVPFSPRTFSRFYLLRLHNYTGILEEQTLRPVCAEWSETPGDLARYHMAVAAVSGVL